MANNGDMPNIRLVETICEMITKVLPPFFKWGGMVLITLFGKDIVANIGGKTTVLNAAISYQNGADKAGTQIPHESFPTLYIIAISVLIVIFVGQMLYIRSLKKTHKKTVDDIAQRNKKLEKKIDPKRSSSKK